MERSQTPSSAEQMRDTDSDKKEKKSSKKRVTHVPLPLEAAAAYEQQERDKLERIVEGDADKKSEKKRKRKRKKKQVTAPEISAAETEQQPEAKAASDVSSRKTKPESKPSKEGEKLEDTAETHEIPADGDFQGELLVSERARRQRERAKQQDDEPQTAPEGEVPADEKTETAEEQPDDISQAGSLVTQASSAGTRASRSASPASSTRSSAPTASSAAAGIVPPAVPPHILQGVGSPNGPYFNQAPATANISTTPATPPETSRDRQAERRSLWTGLIVGGLIEHVRHRRREKRMDKEHGREMSRLETAAQRTKTELEKQIDRLKHEQQTRHKAKLEVAPRPESTPTVQPEATVSSAAAVKKEQLNEKTARTKLEQIIAAHEKAEAADEPPELPPDRRVETSAWHRIEVDKRTGRAVEKPVLAYGKEFENEQHQEQLRKEIEAASLAGQTIQQKYTQTDAGANFGFSNTASSEPVHTDTAAESKKKKATGEGLSVEPVDAVLWVILLVVVGAIIMVLSA